MCCILKVYHILINVTNRPQMRSWSLKGKVSWPVCVCNEGKPFTVILIAICAQCCTNLLCHKHFWDCVGQSLVCIDIFRGYHRLITGYNWQAWFSHISIKFPCVTALHFKDDIWEVEKIQRKIWKISFPSFCLFCMHNLCKHSLDGRHKGGVNMLIVRAHKWIDCQQWWNSLQRDCTFKSASGNLMVSPFGA